MINKKPMPNESVKQWNKRNNMDTKNVKKNARKHQTNRANGTTRWARFRSPIIYNRLIPNEREQKHNIL